MNYLVVVAHPDDEVLGAGATIRRLTDNGHQVALAVLCGKATARANLSDSLGEDQQQATELLGIAKTYASDFPNIKMNTVAHLNMVQFVESCIRDWQAEAIITHHPSDVNIDHQETSRAVNAACRLFQRTTGVPQLRRLWYMEVLSSTEWNLNTAARSFTPNVFVEVGEDRIGRKLEALAAYKGVMRPYPHPRCDEVIRGLAALRGSQAGVAYAEAFENAFTCEAL